MGWSHSEKTLGEYNAFLPSRLTAEDLHDVRLANLMMRAEGQDVADAYLAPVFINGLRRAMGRVSFNLIFADEDLRPLFRPRGSDLTDDNLWKPHRVVKLVEQGKIHAQIRTGYFMPYDGGPPASDWEIVKELEFSGTQQ